MADTVHRPGRAKLRGGIFRCLVTVIMLFVLGSSAMSDARPLGQFCDPTRVKVLCHVSHLAVDGYNEVELEATVKDVEIDTIEFRASGREPKLVFKPAKASKGKLRELRIGEIRSEYRSPLNRIGPVIEISDLEIGKIQLGRARATKFDPVNFLMTKGATVLEFDAETIYAKVLKIQIASDFGLQPRISDS